jgi:hypothetical protein
MDTVAATTGPQSAHHSSLACGIITTQRSPPSRCLVATAPDSSASRLSELYVEIRKREQFSLYVVVGITWGKRYVLPGRAVRVNSRIVGNLTLGLLPTCPSSANHLRLRTKGLPHLHKRMHNSSCWELANR